MSRARPHSKGLFGLSQFVVSAGAEQERHGRPAAKHPKYTGWCRWDNCFIRLLDGMLQAGALGSTDYQLRIPTKIRQIEILDAKPRLPSGSESEPTHVTIVHA